jgi:uncharacterized protein (UPF0261 family)
MEGQTFHDPVADAALFGALRRNLARNIKLVELDMHINDPEFAEAMAGELLANMAAAGRRVSAEDSA